MGDEMGRLPGILVAMVLAVAVFACDAADDHGEDVVRDAATSSDEGTVPNGDQGGPGDYDGTCYDCATVCVDCDAESVATCLAECGRVQGYSDGFMWLESQLHKWGCETDHTQWEPAACP